MSGEGGGGDKHVEDTERTLMMGTLTLYLKPSSGTMSTSKMYFAHGISPERFTLQCGNILLQQKNGQ